MTDEVSHESAGLPPGPARWSGAVEAHRRDARAAILDATASLVESHGPLSVTMSSIAAGAGIGRATLYRYFTNVEAALSAWHERQMEQHLAHLAEVASAPGGAVTRLRSVLHGYSRLSRHRHTGDVEAALHRGAPAQAAHDRLHAMVTALVREAAAEGVVRADVSPAELASYCLAALTAAASMPSGAAVDRLVDVTIDGLQVDINRARNRSADRRSPSARD